MKPAKKIFLSSTCFDLIDLRAEVKSSLEEMGYIVYTSEASDFPVNTHISTYDNCLAVVRQCDIYLLIIHTRYGAPYRGGTEIKLPDEFADGEPSVTVAEYLTALEAGLEVRIWVRDFIWSAATNVNTGRADLESDVLPPTIDPSVFSFIDYIKNHPHEGGSWINQFHSVVDLKSSVIHWLNETSYADTSDFRSAVGEICELLGYDFERSLMNTPGHKRILARQRDSPFGEQDALWPVYRKSGSIASWRHLRDVVRDVTDELTRGICDRALVIVSSPFDETVTSALKNHPLARRIRLITYDDLVSTLIPFTGYLQRIVHDFENFEEFANPGAVKDPVIDIMRRCDLFHYYVPLRGRCSPSDLDEYIQEWLSTSDANQLTLLGDFGTGKSSFALWLTYQLARRILVEGRRDTRIPVFISLRDHVGKIDVREIVVNTLANTYGIRNVNFNSFIKLLDAGRLLIIFDGFDETATKADTGQSLRILRELNSLVRRNAKIILSCRTHFFRTDTEAHSDLGRGLRSRETELFTEQKGRTNFDIVYLKEFDPAQIEEFLNKHFEGDAERTKHTLTTMHSTYNLWDLARRPVLLEMILKVFPRLSRKLGRIVITPAELYQEYIEEWIAFVAKGNEELLDSEGKRNFCDNLAQWMYINNRELLPYSELEDLVHEYFTDRPLSAYAALDTEVRTCSFLNRDSAGNYQFVHRSFMEFFIAKAISKELDLYKYELLSVKGLSFEIRNFLRGLQPDASPYLRAIEHTKRQSEETAGWSGANAVAMLGLIGYDFCGHDFSHTVLSGADFTGGDLTNCNFHGANLSRTTFANAKLTGADFSRADLSQIVIREFRRITCMAWGAERLIVGGEDGSVRVYSSVTWELDAVLRGHDNSIYAVVVSPAEQFLFTVSQERLVVWSIEGLNKFAEFSNQEGEVGPISVKLARDRYEITILGEHGCVFLPAPVLLRSVDELEISVRTYNGLKNADIRTIGQLIAKTEDELLRGLKYFGKKSLNELKDILNGMGLDFGMQVTQLSASGDIADESFQVVLLDKEVQVTHEDGNLVFEARELDDRPVIASYSARYASLAVGTDDGRIIVWDSFTSAKLADFEQGALDCQGLRLDGAKGLEQQVPHAWISLGEWLSSRGAVLAPTQLRKLRRMFDARKYS